MKLQFAPVIKLIVPHGIVSIQRRYFIFKLLFPATTLPDSDPRLAEGAVSWEVANAQGWDVNRACSVAGSGVDASSASAGSCEEEGSAGSPEAGGSMDCWEVDGPPEEGDGSRPGFGILITGLGAPFSSFI